MTGALYLGTLIPLLFLVLFIKGENRILLLFLIWGLTAVLPAIFFNQWCEEYFTLGQEDLLVFFGPVVEEFLKAIPLFITLFSIKKLKGTLILFCAMAAGIGFSIHENFMYLLAFDTGDFLVIVLSILRSFSTALLHGSTVVIISFAFFVSKQSGRIFVSLITGSFVLAVIIHGLYNYLVAVKALAGLAFLIPVGLFLFLLRIITSMRKKKASMYW